MDNKKRLIYVGEAVTKLLRNAYHCLHTGDEEYSIGRARGMVDAVDLIKRQPAVDAVEVVHGRWDKYDCYKCNSDGKPVIRTGNVFVCSVCGREERYREPYCHCGAKMDGDGNG